jgi:hypothetical protein
MNVKIVASQRLHYTAKAQYAFDVRRLGNIITIEPQYKTIGPVIRSAIVALEYDPDLATELMSADYDGIEAILIELGINF